MTNPSSTSLHPASLQRIARDMTATVRRIAPSWVGAELTLERLERDWVLEIPVTLGENGGVMVGVAKDQVVQRVIVQGLLPGYRVLGVGEDGRLLITDGVMRLWARPIEDGDL